jgi:hypothetical protein
MVVKKKILIVTHGFHPEQSPRAFRATELAKEFCRQGHEVTVMAPERSNMRDLLNEFPITFVSLGQLKWKIFNFKSQGGLGKIYNKVVNRTMPLLFEYPMIELIPKIKKIFDSNHNSYDILISVAVPYPIHWGIAAIWKSKLKSQIGIWVADCGDPYCHQENDTFRPPFYFQWIEKWFMRKADYITVPTQNSFKGYFPEFYSKLKVIPQGFRFQDIEKKETINDGIVRFGYGGVFIPGKRDPTEFIDFLISLPQNIRFEFHIYTNSPQFVTPYILSDTRIIVHNPVNRKALLETLSAFNFVVNFANQGSAQTPSKLIDYAIIDKPILNIVTGSLNRQSVEEFLNGDYVQSLKIENIDNYRIENVIQSFIILTECEIII